MPARVARLRFCTWYTHEFETKLHPRPARVFFSALYRQEATRILASLHAVEISHLIAGDFGPHSPRDERLFGVVNEQLRRRALLLLGGGARRAPRGEDPYGAWRRAFLTAASPFLERVEPTYACSRRRIRLLNEACTDELSLTTPRVSPGPDRRADLVSRVNDCIRYLWKQCREDDQARMLACDELQGTS